MQVIKHLMHAFSDCKNTQKSQYKIAICLLSFTESNEKVVSVFGEERGVGDSRRAIVSR